ncbi:MAG: D-glycero-beta-D-manno-heptose-7-phosphate kinase [Candidatus Zixiibacteriota bacterium]|nr:MAG: D-glycero-beta-D-manno-heptose-7-phosphate kinase [candidate division Zixibacteria bacterium]
MIRFTPSRITELFDNFRHQRIAVVGDLMLDRYMWGAVQRISPEAPVPVVEVTSETVKLGGAANVAHNIVTLGAAALPVGVVGDDAYGMNLRGLFEAAGLRVHGIITDADRPTTMKTRIIANDQHVVRADVESKAELSAAAAARLLEVFHQILPEVDGVILEDYNKGVLMPRVIQEIVRLCRESDRFVAVDPKFRNFFNYRGVDLFKPNTKETEEALGAKIETDEDLFLLAGQLFERLNCRSILLTRGEKGMALFPGPNQPPVLVPTRAKKIHDVSGAGDTVIATLVVAKLAGASLYEAASLANYAAGIVCGEVGVVPIEYQRLREAVNDDCE